MTNNMKKLIKKLFTRKYIFFCILQNNIDIQSNCEMIECDSRYVIKEFNNWIVLKKTKLLNENKAGYTLRDCKIIR